jgi:intracellular septation protein
MQMLFDFFPIILFFISYKVAGIFVATAVAMAASLLQVGFSWVKHKKFELMQIVSLVIITLLGTATLLSHNIMFIKWKPTVIYWILAVIFFSTQFIGKKNLTQKLMDNKIVLQQYSWRTLNFSWVAFFSSMGVLNLFVVYHFSTNTWVNFKLFGTLILTLFFVLIQSIYITKCTKCDKLKNEISQNN